MQSNWLARLWLLPLLLVAAGTAALCVDLPVTAWFRAGHCPRDLYTLIRLSEAFAEGHGVAVILLAVLVLDRNCRWGVARLTACSFGAGLTADVAKLFFARARPAYFLGKLHGTNILESFRAEWAGLNVGHAEWQGFPSAHAATAVGLALALAWRYPRGRWLFWCLGLLACTQRVADSYHFVSDVCWAGAIGSAAAWVCLRGPVVSKFFDRLEEKGTKVFERAKKSGSVSKSKKTGELEKKIELAPAKR